MHALAPSSKRPGRGVHLQRDEPQHGDVPLTVSSPAAADLRLSFLFAASIFFFFFTDSSFVNLSVPFEVELGCLSVFVCFFVFFFSGTLIRSRHCGLESTHKCWGGGDTCSRASCISVKCVFLQPRFGFLSDAASAPLGYRPPRNGRFPGGVSLLHRLGVGSC